MTTVRNVESALTNVLAAADRALASEVSQNYEALDRNFHQLEAAAREAFQSKLNDIIWPIIAKLENGEALTKAEQAALEMVVVGEAKYYARSENDVENWKNEIQRLIEAIRELRASNLDDIDALMRLQALCREARRVTPDLAFFYRERERVERFDAATANALDIETGRTLANLIKEMLRSDRL